MAIKKYDFIPAIEFCSIHDMEISFLITLNEYGLIELETIEETIYIPVNQLHDLERIIHLYFELNINIEGIETIIYLLHRSELQQQEINELRNKLRLYEDI